MTNFFPRRRSDAELEAGVSALAAAERATSAAATATAAAAAATAAVATQAQRVIKKPAFQPPPPPNNSTVTVASAAGAAAAAHINREQMKKTISGPLIESEKKKNTASAVTPPPTPTPQELPEHTYANLAQTQAYKSQYALSMAALNSVGLPGSGAENLRRSNSVRNYNYRPTQPDLPEHQLLEMTPPRWRQNLDDILREDMAALTATANQSPSFAETWEQLKKDLNL